MTRNEQPIDPDELNSERLHDERTDQRLRVVGVNEDLNVVETVDEATAETVALELSNGDDGVLDRLGDDLSIVETNAEFATDGGRVHPGDRGVEILDGSDDTEIIDAGDDGVILE